MRIVSLLPVAYGLCFGKPLSPYFNVGQGLLQGGSVYLEVMVGVEYGRADQPGGLDEHLVAHRVRQVLRQESDVDRAQMLHFGDQLGIAGDVYAKPLDFEQIAVAFASDMERNSGRTHRDAIVGGDGAYRNLVPYGLGAIAKRFPPLRSRITVGLPMICVVGRSISAIASVSK